MRPFYFFLRSLALQPCPSERKSNKFELERYSYFYSRTISVVISKRSGKLNK
ncbi:hypothetical protein KFK09_022698 [Dendrobium nobile]|uniref:Uncharacterized protein n=1 Tax=Dendrobium nobile TaxID=94219 RepID=A0A8T3AKN2_DENNO|nr:hypothetical protein KFK09_022698 [Dendrobium nobile]